MVALIGTLAGFAGRRWLVEVVAFAALAGWRPPQAVVASFELEAELVAVRAIVLAIVIAIVTAIVTAIVIAIETAIVVAIALVLESRLLVTESALVFAVV